MIEMLFLLGFSLHNIEEELWLPGWSKHARKYHKEVSPNEFRFAVIIITAIGYLLTFQYFIFGAAYAAAKYVYLGFVLVMIVNVFFPHLVATIVLKKYAPGLITGLLLNAPLGIYILLKKISDLNEFVFVIIAGILLAAFFLLSIKLLFTLGKKLFD